MIRTVEKKLVTIIGARPQFIKAAAVRRVIQAHRSGGSEKKIKEILVHTGQHYDYSMDGIFFEELELPKPDYHLGVGSGSHGTQTALMLERIEAVLQKEQPDGVMVYGDTNSTLAGALTAAKLNIPVVHVEAGLRSYNRAMPEETNRVLTDHLSMILFCPTERSVLNLRKEGIKDGEEKIVKRVGDVMYDSILHYSKLAEKRSTILMRLGLTANGKTPNSVSHTAHSTPRRQPLSYGEKGGVGGTASRSSGYYLATLHRAENTDDPDRLRSILAALSEIGKEAPVILPLHPRTRKMMDTHSLKPDEEGVRLVEPVSYLDMVTLSSHSRIILTDSGGVQKEAYWLKVPCITLREETEWVETVKSGWNILAGIDTEMILEAVRRWKRRRPSEKRIESFGDGKASEKIVEILSDPFD